MNIELKDIENKHAAFIKEWKNDKELSKQILSNFKPVSLLEATEWIERTNASKEQILKGIFVQDIEWVLVGMVRLMFIDLKEKKAELGIYIANKNYKGIGVGKKALQSLLQIGFKHIGLDTIYLKVATNNDAAVKLYANNGFIIEKKLTTQAGGTGEQEDLYFMVLEKRNWNE
jgi:RimJ/RimL family protein N-acetyltransferase